MERKKRRAQGEGALYLRADRKWEARLSLGDTPDGRRVRKKAVARTKAEAATRLKEMQRDHEKDLDLDAQSLTIREWLTKWLAEADIRPRTRITYAASVNRHLIPALGRTKLRELKAEHVARYMRDRLAEEPHPATPQTVKNEHAVLRRALEVARRRRYVQENVARLVSAPRIERSEVNPLRPEEIRKILAAAPGHRWEALFALAASTGLRRGEVLGLSWDDVDLNEGTIRVAHALSRHDRTFHRVAPKTKSSRRTVAMPRSVVDALRRHRKRQNEEKLEPACGSTSGTWSSLGTSASRSRRAVWVTRSMT